MKRIRVSAYSPSCRSSFSRLSPSAVEIGLEWAGWLGPPLGVSRDCDKITRQSQFQNQIYFPAVSKTTLPRMDGRRPQNVRRDRRRPQNNIIMSPEAEASQQHSQTLLLLLLDSEGKKLRCALGGRTDYVESSSSVWQPAKSVTLGLISESC